MDNGLATVTKTLYLPVTRMDREEDYRLAWASFREKIR